MKNDLQKSADDRKREKDVVVPPAGDDDDVGDGKMKSLKSDGSYPLMRRGKFIPGREG